MAACSSWTGQRALHPLPSKSLSDKRGVANYSLPDHLIIQDKAALGNNHQHHHRGGEEEIGLPVFKVNKNGKLKPRRLAFTPDKRNILLTTNRGKVKGLLKGLFKAVMTKKESSSETTKNKVISLEAVDRVQRGATSRRFLLARQEAALELERYNNVATGSASSANSNSSSSAAASNNTLNMLKLLLEDDSPACLSLVYTSTSSGSGGENSSGAPGISTVTCFETLDLVVPNLADYEVLVASLEDLIALQQEERLRYCSFLQLLHHLWVTPLNKQWQSPASLSEFLTVCDRLQVPVKRAVLTIMFKEDVALHSEQWKNNNDTIDENQMPFLAVANLLENILKSTLPRENLPVERLWKELAETDPVPAVQVQAAASTSKRNGNDNNYNDNNGDDDASLELNIHNDDPEDESISAVAFLSFLRSQQKEFQTTLEEATDLVRLLNHQATPDDLLHQKVSDNTTNDSGGGVLSRVDSTASKTGSVNSDRLSKRRFVAFLTSDANDLLHPARGKVGSDDMTRPLSHYWINTSHDTYLDALPNSLNGKSAFAKYIKQQQQPKTPSNGSSNTTTGGGSLAANLTSTFTQNNQANQQNVNEQMYAAALLRGVRCLELDVWDGLNGQEPVIAKSQPLVPSDRRLSVEAVLRLVRKFLQLNPYSFPVILKLENHCSPIVQERLAKLLYEYFGKDHLIAKPALDEDLDASVTLPSPDDMRGKVVILGKRPKKVMPGRMVRKDDFDSENDSYKHADKNKRDSKSFATEISPKRSMPSTSSMNDADSDIDDDDSFGIVVGFTAKGLIRSREPDAVVRAPGELLQRAEDDAKLALDAAEAAEAKAAELQELANQKEQTAEIWGHRSGLTSGDIKRRAAKVARGGNANDFDHEDFLMRGQEEKSAKDEGLEVHEVLPDFLEGSRAKYEQVARAAMDSAGREAQCLAVLRDKEEALRMAKANLEMSQKREATVLENTKRAAADARLHFEHAESAKARVEKVRELLKNSRNQSSSAGTVVQTALTEAKISEKRAADAEARAGRAALAADSERRRADSETRKEELFEQEVNFLHDECMKAAEATKAARERVEKAAAMLDRVNEQIRLIETSSQYRIETQTNSGGGYFIAKHDGKLQERNMCRELIKEASEEHAAAVKNQNGFQEQFEGKASNWKKQADVASQARRAADRSAHIAEELAEHAEEEREAANLRHVARERAEATVENRDSYQSSFEAQLAEAERAAAEANKLAVQSRKRADHLIRETERVKDHSRFVQIVEKLDWEVKQAQCESDTARMERERKDKAVMEEKRCLDTNSEVYQTAVREAAAETDRVRVSHLYQEEAIVAYNDALESRQQATQALEHSKAATYKAEVKRLAVQRAREYKKKMDTMVEIPVDLARITLLHSTRHQNWGKSLSLSNVQCHSFAQNVLLHMMDKNTEEEMRDLVSFTKNHLVRVFPSWKALQNKSITNYDPVLAWSLGCQLVASNFHSTDESLLIVEGRFRQNGSSGYVLKPANLIDNSSKVENDQRWSFHILSGHNLPKPIRKAAGTASPLVKISIYSGSAKETRISYRTKPARHSGLNPVWTSNNKFEFVITSPSISMIALSVWHSMEDGTENFMAAAAFPASCLREGFRSVALFDENHSRAGAYLSSCLLVKASKR